MAAETCWNIFRINFNFLFSSLELWRTLHSPPLMCDLHSLELLHVCFVFFKFNGLLRTYSLVWSRRDDNGGGLAECANISECEVNLKCFCYDSKRHVNSKKNQQQFAWKLSIVKGRIGHDHHLSLTSLHSWKRVKSQGRNVEWFSQHGAFSSTQRHMTIHIWGKISMMFYPYDPDSLSLIINSAAERHDIAGNFSFEHFSSFFWLSHNLHIFSRLLFLNAMKLGELKKKLNLWAAAEALSWYVGKSHGKERRSKTSKKLSLGNDKSLCASMEKSWKRF